MFGKKTGKDDELPDGRKIAKGKKKCPQCNGTGKALLEFKCIKCLGAGYV